MKILRWVFLSLLLIPTAIAEEDETDDSSWVNGEKSILGMNPDNARHFVLFEDVVCKHDSLESLVCFDYGWRNGCFEFYAAYMLSEDIPYILSSSRVPVLQVDSFNRVDINSLIKFESLTGRIIPWAFRDVYVFWRLEVGSLETILEANKGIFHHLMNGEKLRIYFALQNDTIMRSHVSLKGLQPFLENVIEKARAAKPEGEECSG